MGHPLCCCGSGEAGSDRWEEPPYRGNALKYFFVWRSIAKTTFLDFVPGRSGC